MEERTTSFSALSAWLLTISCMMFIGLPLAAGQEVIAQEKIAHEEIAKEEIAQQEVVQEEVAQEEVTGVISDSQPATSALVDQVATPGASPANPPTAPNENGNANSQSCKDEPLHQTFLDRLQEKLSEWSCASASWADGLFTSSQQMHNYRNSHGEIFLGSGWSQRSDFDKVLRFRAHLNLPGVRNRWHAFVGRVDRNEFVTESSNELRALPVAFDRNIKNSLLLGLGYEEPLKKRGALDADMGVRLDLPLDPYVKTSYRIGFPLGDSDLVRVRETVFWQKSERLGTTTRVDWDHVVDDDNLLRWTSSATLSKAIDGWRWYSTLTWYEMINPKQALAYELSANRNNTALNTRIDDYSFTTIYRHNFWRSWLWLEARAGMSWPYRPLTHDRRSNLLGLLAFEMRFGGDD